MVPSSKDLAPSNPSPPFPAERRGTRSSVVRLGTPRAALRQEPHGYPKTEPWKKATKKKTHAFKKKPYAGIWRLGLWPHCPVSTKRDAGKPHPGTFFVMEGSSPKTDQRMRASPDFSPASVARASSRRCAGAHGLQDAEGIVVTMSKWLAGVRPGTASGSAPAAGGW